MSLGTWRFVLAFLVAISHLWAGMMHGPAAYAVWGFFLISGFLMTHVINHKYGFTRPGLSNYAVNRFLRIYPAYFLACLMGYLALVLLPGIGVRPADLNPEFLMPTGWKHWLSNITLLHLWGGANLLVPVSSALSVEVGFYLLVPLMAASPAAAVLGVALSLLLNLKMGLNPGQFGLRYSSFLTCFMAFGVGSLVSHYKPVLQRFASPWTSTTAWMVHCLVWFWFDAWPWTLGLYASLILTAWVLVSFVDRKPSTLDKWLGEFSYPVYLFHTVVGVTLFGLFGNQRSLPFFLAAFGLTMVVSLVVILLVDRPLLGYKKKPAAL